MAEIAELIFLQEYGFIGWILIAIDSILRIDRVEFIIILADLHLHFLTWCINSGTDPNGINASAYIEPMYSLIKPDRTLGVATESDISLLIRACSIFHSSNFKIQFILSVAVHNSAYLKYAESKSEYDISYMSYVATDRKYDNNPWVFQF